jgi:hypothetical protein
MALRTLEEEFAKMGLLTESDLAAGTLADMENEYDEDFDDEDFDEDDDYDEDDELEEASTRRFKRGSASMERKPTKSQIVKKAGGSRKYREGKRKAARFRRTHRSEIARKRDRWERKYSRRKRGLLRRRAGKKREDMDDRLDVLLDELRTLNEDFEGHEGHQIELDVLQKVINCYTNVALCADAVGSRLNEDDELCEDLGGLAEHSVLVCEGIADGEIDLEVAVAELDGYVKDLIEGLGEVADELDEELMIEDEDLDDDEYEDDEDDDEYDDDEEYED